MNIKIRVVKICSSFIEKNLQYFGVLWFINLLQSCWFFFTVVILP